MTEPPASSLHDAPERIRSMVRRIPRGKVSTYGDIASAVGLPGRARLVGRSLRPSDGEPDLPWHRVIAAGGRIALPEGSEGRALQCARLAQEGVPVRSGRVDLKRWQWKRRCDAPVTD